MEVVIYEYLSKKVIEDINSTDISGMLAEALSIYPFNDYVRKEVERSCSSEMPS